MAKLVSESTAAQRPSFGRDGEVANSSRVRRLRNYIHLWMRSRAVAQIVLAAGILVAWDLGVRIFDIPTYLVPSPSSVAIVMWREWHYLAFHSLVTLEEILGGFLASIFIGIPIAILIVYSPFMERALYPLLVASQSVPKIAVAPLLIFWAGIGLTPKVLVAFLIAVFPIIVDTAIGLRSVEPEMLHLARSMGAGDFKIFWKVRIPNSLPYLFAGLKVSITLAVVGAVVAEFIQADAGLGYALLQASSSMNTAMSFAIIITLSIIGIILFGCVSALGARLTYWHSSHRIDQVSGPAA